MAYDDDKLALDTADSEGDEVKKDEELSEEDVEVSVDEMDPTAEDLETTKDEDDDLTLDSDDDLTGPALLKEDAEAIREETDSEPDHLTGSQDDLGITKDNWEADELRSGMEDTEDEEDLESHGFHEERFTDAIDGGSKDDVI